MMPSDDINARITEAVRPIVAEYSERLGEGDDELATVVSYEKVFREAYLQFVIDATVVAETRTATCQVCGDEALIRLPFEMPAPVEDRWADLYGDDGAS